MVQGVVEDQIEAGTPGADDQRPVLLLRQGGETVGSRRRHAGILLLW